MLNNAGLKLLAGVVVGGLVFYSFKKGKIKQDKLDKPFTIGHNAPIPMNPMKHHKKPKHKPGQHLQPSMNFMLI